ncbi:hypothetical protein [Lactobacillus paragasseri]|uniref:Capsid protein n=1 Tax=Lactobacillus paragasseri TaxID=2107999 RepID=A0ABD4ZZ77_9LACO|nr:hypothetical protein [Lactobacillus paragasseri]MDK7952157.1 hypothetical protein [Lactobacillus paragasseri]MDO6360811.1 hypothetical protein [Lactobacillus paragasseri]
MPETGVEAKGFNYVTKDGNLLDQKITAGLFTGALGTPEVDLVNGGRSFTLKTISTSGLQPHTRGKGFNSGTVTDEKTIYTMGQDRDVEFYLDRQEVDETNQELAMANISNVFITEQVQPELDSYRFSKMATSFDNIDASDTEGTLLAKTHKVEENLDATNAYSQLKTGIGKVRKYGTQNLLGYVSSEVMDSLERSKEFTRNITNQNVGTTALESRITSIDGVQLIEVYEPNRFMTKYNFKDGAKPTEDAKAINFLIVAKPAVISIVKENAVFLFAPGQHTEGDGYLYQNRLYHDLFIKKHKRDGIYSSIKKA